MVAEKHLRREDLVGKVIDAHSHIGIALREAAQINFPYCSSAEDLAYRHKANGVDFGVVFPISPAFYYDLPTIIETGELMPAARPISRVPYERENRLLLTDVYRFCPEHSHRFLPFISVDPGRLIDEQIASVRELEQEFAIYGVKIHPLMAQSKALALLDVGAPLSGILRSAQLADPLPCDDRPNRSVLAGGRYPSGRRAPSGAALLPRPLHLLSPGVTGAGRGAAQRVR